MTAKSTSLSLPRAALSDAVLIFLSSFLARRFLAESPSLSVVPATVSGFPLPRRSTVAKKRTRDPLDQPVSVTSVQNPKEEQRGSNRRRLIRRKKTNNTP
jgi:hypothetical protein